MVLILKPLILQEPSLETEAYNQRANFQFLRHHLQPSKANVSEITSYIFSSLLTLLKYPMYYGKLKDWPALKITPVIEYVVYQDYTRLLQSTFVSLNTAATILLKCE